MKLFNIGWKLNHRKGSECRTLVSVKPVVDKSHIFAAPRGLLVITIYRQTCGSTHTRKHNTVGLGLVMQPRSIRNINTFVASSFERDVWHTYSNLTPAGPAVR